MRFIFFLLLFVFMGSLLAQTTVNPDISVIGELDLTHLDEETTLSASSIEIAIEGYVNPYARAEVYLHKHLDGHPIELEEAVLSIERGLPLGFALRAGKFRPEFGGMNKQHLHLFPYIILPEPVAQVLGDHKWSSAGLEAKWLLPLPWYNNLSFAYLQEGISTEGHAHDEEQEVETHAETGKAFSARYSSFFDLGEVSHLEVGLSTYQLLDDSDANMAALDFKYKWRPNKYRSITWQNELLRLGPVTHVEEGGAEELHEVIAAYSMLNYQFNKVWNVGAIVDYSSDIEESVYKSSGLFVGFSPVEETTVLRIFVKQAQHGDHNPGFLLQAQLLWSLGPHKAHQF
ncbi:MAG: hypothetical protein H8E26_03595 [FCB group bacterium]|nr:hypothetical protein [FCB group bacterium]MBL7028216.1 hypothetical protein [Candidatus Neomarinimicrobiota bacterium]MBL7122478.1 hypothetical protein [Candidatus Neomarinimicrobiota bacterium]